MLSIITINKNNASGLKKTLDSLQIQTLQNFQWIFVDGISSDLSHSLANKFQREGDVLISETDSGIYNAMNKGADYASGDKILFLNSGDALISSTALELVSKEWSDDLDIILFGFSVRGQHRMPHNNWWRYWSIPTSHQAIIYRADLLTCQKFDESYKYAADFEHYLRVNMEPLKIKRVSEIFVLNEPYGSDRHLEKVLIEYRQALIKNGAPKVWANLVFFLKLHYLKFALK
jgi:glycosyltransferase involved in cell wall biosynthesis